MKQVNHLRALSVRYYGATNTLPSRIKITDCRGIIEKPLWLNFDAGFDSEVDQAIHELQRRGWNITARAMAEEGYVLLTNTWMGSLASAPTWDIAGAEFKKKAMSPRLS